MKTFNWEAFKVASRKIVVHCATESQAIDFTANMHFNGLKWATGDSYVIEGLESNNNWGEYAKDTCYTSDGKSSLLSFYLNNGYTVLEWSDYSNVFEPLDFVKQTTTKRNKFISFDTLEDALSFMLLANVKYLPEQYNLTKELKQIVDSCNNKEFEQVCINKEGKVLKKSYCSSHYSADIVPWSTYNNLNPIEDTDKLTTKLKMSEFPWGKFYNGLVAVKFKSKLEVETFVAQSVLSRAPKLTSKLAYGIKDNITSNWSHFKDAMIIVNKDAVMKQSRALEKKLIDVLIWEDYEKDYISFDEFIKGNIIIHYKEHSKGDFTELGKILTILFNKGIRRIKVGEKVISLSSLTDIDKIKDILKDKHLARLCNCYGLSIDADGLIVDANIKNPKIKNDDSRKIMDFATSELDLEFFNVDNKVSISSNDSEMGDTIVYEENEAILKNKDTMNEKVVYQSQEDTMVVCEDTKVNVNSTIVSEDDTKVNTEGTDVNTEGTDVFNWNDFTNEELKVAVQCDSLNEANEFITKAISKKVIDIDNQQADLLLQPSEDYKHNLCYLYKNEKVLMYSSKMARSMGYNVVNWNTNEDAFITKDKLHTGMIVKLKCELTFTVVKDIKTSAFTGDALINYSNGQMIPLDNYSNSLEYKEDIGEVKLFSYNRHIDKVKSFDRNSLTIVEAFVNNNIYNLGYTDSNENKLVTVSKRKEEKALTLLEIQGLLGFNVKLIETQN